MNSLITIRRVFCGGFVLGMALVLSSPMPSLHAQPAPEKTMPGGSMMNQNRDMMMNRGKMMEMHKKMMAEHAQMIADLKAKDAELAELIAKMNRAPQAAKVDMLADIVTRMAAQQTALYAGMDKMHQTMTEGGMPMGSCPCLMDSTDAKSTDAPAAQK